MASKFPIIAGHSWIADIMHPRQVVPSIFLPHCNLRCPYCINRDLVNGVIKKSENISDLLKRFTLAGEKYVLVTGAEALLSEGIFDLFESIKAYGLKVALATNGMLHNRLVEAIDKDLVDHVVMDIKTSLVYDRYKKVSGINLGAKAFSSIVKSVDYLMETDKVSHEFRTTTCSKYVDKNDVFSIAKYIAPNSMYVLQYYTIHQTLDPDLSDPKYIIPFETLLEWKAELESVLNTIIVREV
jgi:pyruvate formate lyase activating enzyme